MNINNMTRLIVAVGFGCSLIALLSRASRADGKQIILASLPMPHAAQESDLQDRRAALTSALQQLEPGTATRADVEKLLTLRDGGPQGTFTTRYYAEPGIIVEVPYDQTGGTWTDTNHISGPIMIIPGRYHNF